MENLPAIIPKKSLRVNTCEEVHFLAKQKKALFVSVWNKAIPAAFFNSWQVSSLIPFLKRYEVTVYTKAASKKLPFHKIIKAKSCLQK